MISLPRPPVRGEKLTADLLRDIIAAIRQCRPIAGAGINLQESLNGVVIAATPATEEAAAEAFTHRFQMDYEETSSGDDSTSATYDLLIRKGSIWEMIDGVATEKDWALGDGITEDSDDDDLWRITSAEDGSLYVTYEEESALYRLNYGAATEPLYVIAEFTRSESSSNPYPVVTQHIVGDIFHVAEVAAEETPAAWTVRKFVTTNEDGSTTTSWKVFSPLWVTGQTQNYYQNVSPGDWIELPAADGSIYAYLTWTGTANSDGTNTWVISGAGVRITNNLADVPEDVEPVAAGSGQSSSSTTEAVEGSRSIVVPIGVFASDATTGEVTWTQLHVGAIVEQCTFDTATAASALTLGAPYYNAETGKIMQDLGTWDVSTTPPTFTPAVTGAVEIDAPMRTVLTKTKTTSSGSGTSSSESTTEVDTIATQSAPLPFFSGDETAWLSRKTATPGVIDVTEPANETETGSLYQKQTTIEFFSDVDPTETTETPLGTIVEDANESTTYSSSGS